MFIKKITTAERDKLQALNVELDARKAIISEFLKSGVNVTTPAFKAYEEAYFKVFMEFEQAKREVEKNYVLGELTDDVTANWEVNYDKCEITITLK